MRNFIAAILAALLAAPALAADVGQAAPAFTLPRQGGGTVSLADLKGHVVYLDFWASWCGPCRQSFPWMNQALARFKSRGLEIIAVNVDAKTADAQAFLEKIPARFTVAFDPAGATPAAYGLKGMPTSFLIGADGKILMVHASFKEQDRGELEARIEQALAAKP